jgi:hypothetical protein
MKKHAENVVANSNNQNGSQKLKVFNFFLSAII